MNICKKCGLPDGLVLREDGLVLPSLRIKLDDQGICNLCNDYEKDPYDPEANHHLFLELLEQTKGTHPFDAMVGVSGGKDGCYVVYDLIRKYDLKVLMFSSQIFQTETATKKCDEFAEKLQKKYPNNVTYLPFRKSNNDSTLMFKKAFLTGGVPCSWCTLSGILTSVTYPYLIQCAPLFVSGVEPKQMYSHRYVNSQNPRETASSRHKFENFEDFQRDLLAQLLKEIVVLFNNDKEEMKRVLSIDSSIVISDPKTSYYQNAINGITNFIENGIEDQTKKNNLLKALQELTFENNKLHHNICYFYYHHYDENMIRETLKNDLDYTAPPTHSDCCMHGAIDYIFGQKDLLPLSTTVAETAALTRLGEISKAEVESLIMNKNDRVAYPSETDIKNFCEFLDITEKEFNTTIENLKESFRKFIPNMI